MRIHLLLCLAAAAIAGACTGEIGDVPQRPAYGEGAVGPASAPTGAAPTDLPLSRLTRTQYQNTLRDLFTPYAVVLPDLSPPVDVTVEGFDDNVAAQTPTAASVEAYHAVAVRVSSAALENASTFLGCTPASRAEEDACAAKFIAEFAKRAYRRPITGDDTAKLVALYTGVRGDGDDFSSAMAETLQAMLQSPNFLYRVEFGAPGGAGSDPNTVTLAPYEMASRLSYLLWNTMPDDALFAAAESGALGTVDGIEKEARRMLGDPRAHDAMQNFFRQWLRFDLMQDLSKDRTAFPTFGSTTSLAMRQSAEKFVDGVFFGTGSLTTLLTDDHAWVNDILAPIYGVPATGSAELKLVAVDATQRSGILTNAGIMAALAHPTDDAPVLRGKFLLDRFVCAPPPPVPAKFPPVEPSSAANPKTTRERFAQLHEQGPCAGCHHPMDGLGFGFEHYDAVGAWRTQDSGFPVDASGWFPELGDLKGTFDGAIDLGKKLAASHTVHECVASQVTRYALGIDAGRVDHEKLAPVVSAFEASKLDMRELVVALVKSDPFRTRLVMR